jgi:CDP-diacylglycerol--glycerol-3-phosphate 3-phosphatidyltransferase
MIPAFVIFGLIETQWAQIIALLIFIGASLTDLLDGKIARKRGLVTNFGKFIDPIADKLLVMAALVLLVGQGRMPSWVCIVMLAREFAISGFRLVAADSGKVIAAGPLGKIKTVLQMSAIIALLLLTPPAAFPYLGNFGVILANVITYAAAVMTLWSGADYIVRNFNCIRDM